MTSWMENKVPLLIGWTRVPGLYEWHELAQVVQLDASRVYCFLDRGNGLIQVVSRSIRTGEGAGCATDKENDR